MKEIEEKVFDLVRDFIKPSLLVISSERLQKATEHVPEQFRHPNFNLQILNIQGFKLVVQVTQKPDVCEVYGQERL